MEVNQLVSTYNTANPFEIADYLGIEYDFKVLPNDLKGILVSSEKDTPLILINEDIQDISFKYYVMAHELKHAIDHYGFEWILLRYFWWKRKIRTRSRYVCV